MQCRLWLVEKIQYDKKLNQHKKADMRGRNKQERNGNPIRPSRSRQNSFRGGEGSYAL